MSTTAKASAASTSWPTKIWWNCTAGDEVAREPLPTGRDSTTQGAAQTWAEMEAAGCTYVRETNSALCQSTIAPQTVYAAIMRAMGMRVRSQMAAMHEAA